MKENKSYIYSFVFSVALTTAILPFLWVDFIPGFIALVMNFIGALMIYPWFFLWLSKREWSLPLLVWEPPQ